MIDFAKRHRAALERISAAFISVTLSEAGAEDPAQPRAEREHAAADVQRMIDVFVTETGWRPERMLPVAGALVYSKYNFFIRFVMKRIARKAGAPTDASRDYEFTDWPALDRFVERAGQASGTMTGRCASWSIGLIAAACSAGCGFAMRPVMFEATPATGRRLAGEWRGEYTMSGHDRHGLIAFRLKAADARPPATC